MNLSRVSSRVVHAVLANRTALTCQPVRTATTIEDLKIHWVRPQKVSFMSPERTGDLGLDVQVEPTELTKYFDKCKELETADELVKRMFTYEFTSRKEVMLKKREKIMDLVKRHKDDEHSMEAKIASLTTEIYSLRSYMEQHPKNNVVKVQLKEMIEKRKKFLKILRRWDYRRFEWILERLNLIYKPQPVELPLRVERKLSMRRLTQIRCDEIRQEKLDEFRAELEAQQKEFFKEKAEKLIFMRKEELACGVKPTVTTEDIREACDRAGMQYPPEC